MSEQLVDEWATSEDVADPEKLPKMVGWRILVRPKEAKTMIGSIHLAPSSQEAEEYNNQEGRILAIGPMAWKGDGKDRSNNTPWHGGPWAEVGDRIIYGRYSGQKIEIDSVKLVIIDDDVITGVLPDGVILKAYV